MALKIAVLAPMPSASVTTAMRVKAGPPQEISQCVANIAHERSFKPPISKPQNSTKITNENPTCCALVS